MATLTGSMRLLLSFILALFLACMTPVEAGSRTWEPSHQADSHIARWVHFSSHRRSTKPWTNKRIPICYDTVEAENTLKDYIRGAMNLYYAAGLPDEYKVERAHQIKCATERENVLWVSLANSLSATIGMASPKGNREGPTAHLMLSDKHLPDPTSNIAHELGHAWGLYHEQQNPVFWAPNNFDHIFWFRCENLRDFDQKTQGLEPFEIWGHDGICRSSDSAAHAGFSAFDWLPMVDGTSKLGYFVNEDDVDWNSIMMVPSFLGGNKKGSPMTRRDGSEIKGNFAPSAQDVEGIVHIHTGAIIFPEEVLLNDPRSDQYDLFRQYAPGCIH